LIPFIPKSPLIVLFMMAFVALGFFGDLSGASWGTDVTLTVSERDDISTGFTRDEYFPINRWRLQAPDFSWKESRSAGEGGPVFPQGVYCGGDCVLPLVSMEEGHRIIEAIYARFPDTSFNSSYDKTARSSPIITLGLSGE
jgi:hypothetical protein